MENVMPLRVVGAAPPEALPAASQRVTTAGDLARSAMREHLDAMVALEPLVRADGSPDAIHDTRVAMRRLRAALSLFEGMFPPRALRLNEELRWIAGAFGAVRDLDVQRQGIARWSEVATEQERDGFEAIDALITARRDTAYAHLLRTLDSRRYARLKDSLDGFIRRAPSSRNAAAMLPAPIVMPELIVDRHRATRKRGRKLSRSATASELHALRIKAKRFRYALEIVAPMYPDPAKNLIKRLVRLQDVLGDIQDAEVAIHELETLGRSAGRRLPASAAFAMGRIAERESERARELRRRVPGAFAAVEGKRWKQLKREMERGRRAGAVPIVG